MNTLIPQEFIETALVTTDEVKDFIIEDQEDYEYAGSLGKIYQNEIKKIENYFKPKKSKAKSVHQDWVDAEKEAVGQYKEAKETLKKTMLTYEQKLEDLRRAEEKRLREELSKKQKEEREKAEKEGIEIESPEITPEDIVVGSAIFKKGTTRKNWKAEVTNFKALVKWINETGNLQYLDPNAKKLNDMAKMVEGESTVPGVRFYNDPVKVF